MPRIGSTRPSTGRIVGSFQRIDRTDAALPIAPIDPPGHRAIDSHLPALSIVDSLDTGFVDS